MIRGNFTENWLKEGVSRFLAAGMEPAAYPKFIIWPLIVNDKIFKSRIFLAKH